jgi:hypothetical protein
MLAETDGLRPHPIVIGAAEASLAGKHPDSAWVDQRAQQLMRHACIERSENVARSAHRSDR